MKIYNNLFIGIPLPQELIKQYKHTARVLSAALPEIRINSDKNLHITILFLGQQKEKDVEKICQRTVAHLPLLKNTELVIEGIGYFNNNFMDVIYLKVKEGGNLGQFYEHVRDDLVEFTSSVKRNYDPHLTVARVKLGKLSASTLHLSQESKKILADIRWEFPITEVRIYGRDAEKKNKPVIIDTLAV